MARKPRKSDIARARQSQRVSPPIRFTADYDHVTPEKTVTYPAGAVIDPPADVRAAALARRKAVVHRA